MIGDIHYLAWNPQTVRALYTIQILNMYSGGGESAEEMIEGAKMAHFSCL